MSNRYSRYQTIVSRESDLKIDEDHWLKQLEKNLEKNAVQSRRVDQSLFDQINGIMNNKSKYSSVSAAVEDMMQRSGLTGYLSKTSQEEQSNGKLNNLSREDKVASHHELSKKEEKQLQKATKIILPILFKKVPFVKKTIENYIKDTKGNLPVPAIVEKIKAIHNKDVDDAKDWEDINLLKFISDSNFKEKSSNSNHSNDSNLGFVRDTEIDQNDSNTDAFSALMPAKI